MLVMSREKDGVIVIGDDIRVMVIDVTRGKVRIGIDAPSHVPVHREEIYNAIHKEAESAGSAGLPDS